MAVPPQGAAKLDLTFVRELSESFPDNPWRMIPTNLIVADRKERFHSDWSVTKHLAGIGGVYALLLPTTWFFPSRTLQLHGPNRCKIPFEFSVSDLTNDGYGVVYIGRTSNLWQRFRGHLTPGEPKDGGQVKYGLLNSGIAPDEQAALRTLREHARIIYSELSGPEHCANRDLLELSLCVRFGPPFNIKSER